MKKIFFIIFTMLILTVSCKVNKEPITPEKFKLSMEEKGFTVIDSTSQFNGSQLKINEAMIAKNSNYQIEFYVIADEDQAVQMFASNKQRFQLSKGNGAVETSSSIGNHSRYTLKANSKYKVLSRVKNTLIYIDAPAIYENDIKEIMKSL